MMESKHGNPILVHRGDLTQPGGGEISTRNLYEFLPEGTLLVSPYNPGEGVCFTCVRTNEHTRVLGSFPYLRRTAHQADVARFTSKLPDLDPQYIVMTQPSFYDGSLYLKMPEMYRDRVVALWRCEVGKDPLDHELESGQFHNRFVGMAKSALRWRMRGQIARSVRGNLAISESVASSLVSIGVSPDNIHTIQNQVGGEISPTYRLHNPTLHRKEYLDDDELGVLIVSRISPEKGLQWIPPLLSHLRTITQDITTPRHFERVRVTLVGPDASPQGSEFGTRLLRDSLTVLSESDPAVSFEYVGPKDHPDLERYYNTYDVLFAPSPKEGFGRVIIEAMSGGMIVLGNSNCSATRELLSKAPFGTGMLINSPSEAAESILSLMNPDVQLRTYQETAWKWALDSFSLERAKRDFFEAITKIGLAP